MGTPVEMLWESDDASTVITDRFGFADADDAATWVTRTLDERWGLSVEACERIVMSDHNALAWVRTPAGRLIVKWSIARHRFARLAELARLTAWLGDQGMPVSQPLTTLDGQRQVEVDNVSMHVQRVIDGSLLDVTDPSQVHEAGAALARQHHALAAYPDPEAIGETHSPSRELDDEIETWLAAYPEHLPPEAREVVRRLAASADAVTDLPPRQLVHGDVRSANVLWAGTGVAAFIDLEDAHLGHPIRELTQGAVLLGTRFHDWGPVPREVHAQLREGYESVRPLSAAEASWWDALVLSCSLQMVPPGDDPTGWGEAAAHLWRRAR